MRIIFTVNALHTIKFMELITKEHDVLAITTGKHFHAACNKIKLIPSFNVIQNIVDEFNADIVIASDIEYTLPSFQSLTGASLFYSDSRSCNILDDKISFTHLCRDLELPYPETIILDNDDIQKGINSIDKKYLSGDYLLKPSNLCNGRGIVKLTSETHSDHFNQSSSWMIQQRIHGKDLSLTAICKDGRILSLIVYESIFSNKNSSMIIRKVIQSNRITEECHTLTRKIVEQMRYTGFLGLDLRITEQQNIYLLEANPVLTQGILWMPPISTSLLRSMAGNTPHHHEKQLHNENKLLIDNFYLLRTIINHPLTIIKHLPSIAIHGRSDYSLRQVAKLIQYLVGAHGLLKTVRFFKHGHFDLLPSFDDSIET
ncbi:putative ATP-grasp superfamily ATP-dependent carboligase [Sinobacterium caligoides]|uniref:Putative ATP-grasp superfamily ATP-dependent carboligase n=1 Tax=Sinobacterium caligoides TaxID=933926 RepID=A0A3N2DDN3_9GAMM|nr:ATP-grasp domain-containing protein [Sinobacterium caligoides]ROR97905.1 putative ATP-grasp superfamily ATP-dependent carboligase [Sinobacterium caligoides]